MEITDKLEITEKIIDTLLYSLDEVRNIVRNLSLEQQTELLPDEEFEFILNKIRNVTGDVVESLEEVDESESDNQLNILQAIEKEKTGEQKSKKIAKKKPGKDYEEILERVQDQELVNDDLIKKELLIHDNKKSNEKKPKKDILPKNEEILTPSKENSKQQTVDQIREKDNKKAHVKPSAPIPEEQLSDDLSQDNLFQDYLLEMNEYFDQLEQSIMLLESDPEHLNIVFRLFHNAKGAAGIMRHEILKQICHAAENLLDSVRNSELIIDSNIVNTLLYALDKARKCIKTTSVEKPEESMAKVELVAILSRINEVFCSNSSFAQSAVIEDSIFTQEENRTDMGSLEEKTVENEKKVESIRIASSKLDMLIDRVGELVIFNNQVRETKFVHSCKDMDFLNKFAQLNQVVTDLQRTTMALRMVPVGSILRKMIRLVRDYSSQAGKKISLTVSGENTEIDRNMVDRLYDPLMHVIRNACDHGIEKLDVRKRQNKSETGTISIKASHQGNSIVIDIGDDGCGLDKDAILSKAINMGLVSPDEKLTDVALFKLIMLPGFSTAKTITEMSGRGVGMDVVNQSITALGGSCEISSESGKGTNFRINLPLTLAIMEGMLISINDDLYIIPILNIQRIIRPKKEDISTVMNKGELFKLSDGRILPIIRLRRVFPMYEDSPDESKSIAIIIKAIDGDFALIVDKMIGIQDIVIKSLGPKFKDLDGVAGSSIMGDGRVGLILDVNKLMGK